MKASEAQSFHQLKTELGEGDGSSVPAATPTPPSEQSSTCSTSDAKTPWLCGYMLAALEYASKTVSTIEVQRETSGSFCVEPVTPFMKRVHQLREVGESTGSGKTQTPVALFLPWSTKRGTCLRKSECLL